MQKPATLADKLKNCLRAVIERNKTEDLAEQIELIDDSKIELAVLLADRFMEPRFMEKGEPMKEWKWIREDMKFRYAQYERRYGKKKADSLGMLISREHVEKFTDRLEDSVPVFAQSSAFLDPLDLLANCPAPYARWNELFDCIEECYRKYSS